MDKKSIYITPFRRNNSNNVTHATPIKNSFSGKLPEKDPVVDVIDSIDNVDHSTNKNQSFSESWEDIDYGPCEKDQSDIISKMNNLQIIKKNESSNELLEDLQKYSYILELTGLTLSHNTMNIENELKQYGFKHTNIIWIDDFSALAVFKSTEEALVASKIDSSFIHFEKLENSSIKTLRYAKKKQNELFPLRQRPRIFSTVAGRLVSRALGVQYHPNSVKMELENQLINEERDKKRNIKKNEIWFDES